MKAQKISITVMAVALLLLSTNLFAQRGAGNNREDRPRGNQQEICQNIPDLTTEQETKIEALRVDHLKKTNDYRNQLNELRAKKQTLMTSEKTDLNAINGVIDQMTGLQNKMMKEKAKMHQDVRSLLTDAQKVYFDSRPMRGHGNKHDRGMREERGLGYGRQN
jgi:Spy/CpxP family protein refolding chaperone